ncbi:hypothetical protein TNCV_4950621 [Trichonephila clavipes]|nr:hypothetical protein TNCV_4950621 [Trichonephila clavipes]
MPGKQVLTTCSKCMLLYFTRYMKLVKSIIQTVNGEGDTCRTMKWKIPDSIQQMTPEHIQYLEWEKPNNPACSLDLVPPDSSSFAMMKSALLELFLGSNEVDHQAMKKFLKS